MAMLYAMATAVGIAVWGILGALILMLVKRKRANGNSSVAVSSADAGSESTSGARADVGGVHIHIHVGHTQGVESDDHDGEHSYYLPADMLRPGAIDGERIRALPDGGASGLMESGELANRRARADLPRRARRAQGVEVAE